ncbi:hypothetical protein [Variovorax sp. W2I14]|uniref:hypothetical protein n=1 Tax=Variovorax sp. W2I14 TaxID=3042290 RepID=UPI003D216BAF
MTKVFDLAPSWLYAAALALLLVLLLGQRVQVSNAKAAQARSAQALTDYKLSISETSRILQADNDRKAADNNARQLEALNAARTRETLASAAAGALRLERDKLLDAVRIASRRDRVPSTTATAEAQSAGPLANVFGQCTAEVQELVDAADDHASDVQTLIDSWPR